MIVFLTPDAATSRQLRACLLELARAGVTTSAHPRRRSPFITRGWMRPERRIRRWMLKHLVRPHILISHTNRLGWSTQASRNGGDLSVVYVRPEYMIMQDLFGTAWFPVESDSAAWGELVYLDQALKSYPTVAMEDLFSGAIDMWPALARLTEMTIKADHDFSRDRESAARTYRKALAAMLRLGDPDSASGREGSAILSGDYPVRASGPGLRFLASGWCSAEQDFAWNDGYSASLVVPACGGETKVNCRIQGHVMLHPRNAMEVRIYMEGELLRSLRYTPDASPAFDVSLVLSRPEAGAYRVSLQFSDPVRPSDLGIGSDSRRLALALSNISFEGAPHSAASVSPQRRGSSLSSRNKVAAEVGATESHDLSFLSEPIAENLMRRHPDGLILVLASDDEVATAVAERCAALGRRRVVTASATAEATSAGAVEEDHTSSSSAGEMPWSLRGDLDGVAAELSVRDLAVDIVVLCDEAQFSPWFHRSAGCSAAARLSGASLVLNVSDPYDSELEFLIYSQTWGFLVQVSDAAAVCSRLAL